ncbi:hypothetical protein GJAV_G00261440 [Gymnothorax javanicus]|nr:hypothetical protein GJAV_G00261440 [Gymnothorax javanicus]
MRISHTVESTYISPVDLRCCSQTDVQISYTLMFPPTQNFYLIKAVPQIMCMCVQCFSWKFGSCTKNSYHFGSHLSSC